MLRQSFLSTPDELREAARIDGAGEYRAFAQVMLPLVKPTIAATATVQFLDAWNSYLDPLVFISNWKKWTIPLALNQFVGTEVTQYNLTMAACCMAGCTGIYRIPVRTEVLPERLVRRCG